MKYLFIINPAAGKKDTSEAILEQANIVLVRVIMIITLPKEN